jgi:hypothetical protein
LKKAEAPCTATAAPWILAATILGSSMAFIALSALQSSFRARSRKGLPKRCSGPQARLHPLRTARRRACNDARTWTRYAT